MGYAQGTPPRDYLSTKETAQAIGITIGRLQMCVWKEVFKLPARASSGAFMWYFKDIDRASRALMGRPYEPAEESI